MKKILISLLALLIIASSIFISTIIVHKNSTNDLRNQIQQTQKFKQLKKNYQSLISISSYKNSEQQVVYSAPIVNDDYFNVVFDETNLSFVVQNNQEETRYDIIKGETDFLLVDHEANTATSLAKIINNESRTNEQKLNFAIVISGSALVLATVAVIIGYILTPIISIVRSFFSWLFSVFTTVVSWFNTPVYEQIPTKIELVVKIGETISTVVFSIVTAGFKALDEGIFALAFPFVNNVYVAVSLISRDEAVWTLANSTPGELEIDGKKRETTISTYTLNGDHANGAAKDAYALHTSNPELRLSIHHSAEDNEHTNSTIFSHYHPGNIQYGTLPAHSFYGWPIFTL